MTTLPLPPPFIPLPSVPNFRALLPPASFPPTKPTNSLPILYRSGSPSHITPADIATLHALHITHIFDLSSSTEVAKSLATRGAQSLEIDGITRIHAPVFADREYTPESMALRFQQYASTDATAGFVAAYREILRQGAAAFRRVFEFLGAHPPSTETEAEEKCLVHCSAGKDRTGVFCALVLMLAGAGDAEIAEEYALSEAGLAGVRAGIVERLVNGELGEGLDREGAERMVGARRESMLAVCGVVKEEFGGVRGYLGEWCGFGEGELEAVRRAVGGR